MLVIAGANDIRKLTSPFAFARAQRELLERIHRKYPSAPVFMTNVPDVSNRYFSLHLGLRRTQVVAPLRLPLRYLIDTDDGIQNTLAHKFRATLVDHALSQKRDADDPRFISGDGLHPNDAGHARIAAFMWPSLRKALLGE